MAPRAARRLILCHVAEDAFAPRTRTLLGRLGYRILRPEELVGLPRFLSARRPDLRIVEEGRLAELPEDGGEKPVPVIVVGSGARVLDRDDGVAGAVRRPVGVHDLYRLLQSLLEETPRATLRAATDLPVRCRDGEREWEGRIVSLSENGCLLASPPELRLGADVDLDFELLGGVAIATCADVAYRLPQGYGLVFSDGSAARRRAIAACVLDLLAA
jgi:hypothetical protein